MGNFCVDLHRETSIPSQISHYNKNSKVCEFNLNQMSKLQLIVGSYRYHQADLLLVFSQVQFVQYSPQIKDYTQNYLEFIQNISSHSSKIINVNVNQSCPYKRFTVLLLSSYDSQQSQSYLRQFEQIICEILDTCSQFTFQIYQTSENGKGVPNQTLIAQFIKFLMTYKKPIRIYLISKHLKLLNMVRYEMAKRGCYKQLLKLDR